MEQKPTVGRIVNFTLANGEVRPAIVVRVWSASCVNVRVFLDGSNDAGGPLTIKTAEGHSYDVCDESGWATSVNYDEGVDGAAPPPRTWHWPTRA